MEKAKFNRSPKIKVLEMKNDFMVFELTETDLSMANALRRIMIAEVPTMCIDLVTFETNTTVLKDEVLAHRLGLIPLRSHLKRMSQWNYAHDCPCDGNCDKCSVTLSLDCDYNTMVRENPGQQDVNVPITSRNLISHDDSVQPVHFSNENEERRSQDLGICLVLLGPGQQLKLSCVARKGIGKEHSKWTPTATVALKHDPIVKLNEEILNEYDEDQKHALVNCCPSTVFSYDNVAGTVVISNAADCIYCKECIYTTEEFRKNPEDELGVSVQQSNDKFTFTVETTGALHAKEVVKDALSILAMKLNRLDHCADNLAEK